jgi:hypothetical protein
MHAQRLRTKLGPVIRTGSVMPKHIVRLIALIVGFAAVAYAPAVARLLRSV